MFPLNQKVIIQFSCFLCTFLTEPIIVELTFRNPLKVSLTLSNLSLLWKFTADGTILKDKTSEPITGESISNEEASTLQVKTMKTSYSSWSVIIKWMFGIHCWRFLLFFLCKLFLDGTKRWHCHNWDHQGVSYRTGRNQNGKKRLSVTVGERVLQCVTEWRVFVSSQVDVQLTNTSTVNINFLFDLRPDWGSSLTERVSWTS